MVALIPYLPPPVVITNGDTTPITGGEFLICLAIVLGAAVLGALIGWLVTKDL